MFCALGLENTGSNKNNKNNPSLMFVGFGSFRSLFVICVYCMKNYLFPHANLKGTNNNNICVITCIHWHI